ncbi:MAG: hypothetical protein FJ137_03820 [Deltaproteobacteria bacterium]|nr:hypothetical protein [Deltaproteobacteria bacterium]
MNNLLPRLTLALVSACVAMVGCSKPAEPPAAAPAPAVPVASPPPSAPPVATAVDAPADIKPDNPDQVAAALERELETDAADENKE